MAGSAATERRNFGSDRQAKPVAVLSVDATPIAMS